MENKVLEIEDIKKILPQRYPFLMIDRVVEASAEKVVAIKNVSVNEHFFPGHFPEAPIMPGTLIIEAMAQVSTFLFYDPQKKDEKLNFYLGIVKDTRFLKVVLPGDQLRIEAQSIRLAEDSATVKVTATVDKNKVCEGELVFVRRK